MFPILSLPIDHIEERLKEQELWAKSRNSPQLRIPDIDIISPMHSVPRRRTPARMRTYFLRQFERSGSLMEAAARAGITPRTVQRWRSRDPRFAFHFNALIERREAVLADAAIQRAGRVQRRIYHCFRGKEVALGRTHQRPDAEIRAGPLRPRPRARRAATRFRRRGREARRGAEPRAASGDRGAWPGSGSQGPEAKQAEILAGQIIQDRIKKMSPSMRQAFEDAGR